jgi:hypothetical protein
VSKRDDPTPLCLQLPTTATKLAERFHYLYETLAPNFNYKTRPESAVPWENVPESNRALMVAVCDLILDELEVDRDDH